MTIFPFNFELIFISKACKHVAVVVVVVVIIVIVVIDIVIDVLGVTFHIHYFDISSLHIHITFMMW